MLAIVVACLIGVSLAELHQYIPMANDTVRTPDGELGICHGTSTTWGSYPYAVALRYNTGGACCSGSIISLNPGIILTAAHCNGCTGAIRVGCNNPNNCDGDSYPISQFIQHPNYGQGTQFSNDIAVIRTATAIVTSGAAARAIPSLETTQGNSRIVGYGITESGSIPTSLQTTTMSIIENTQCQSIMSAALGGGTYIDSSMICVRGGSAGQDNVQATCSGDSGGPWSQTSGSNQIGVTSWGLQGSGAGCSSCNCCTGYPSVGANVAHFYSWINGYTTAWTDKYAE